jgi:hypothetical protein
MWVWSFTFKGENKLRVFENSALMKKCGPKREKVSGDCKKFIMGSFMICIPHQILSGCSNQEE